MNLSLEQLQAELARLQAENNALKTKAIGQLGIKVSGKGAVSVYRLQRFPITLYQDQWKRLAEEMPKILAFIEANKASLTTKADAKVEDKPATEAA